MCLALVAGVLAVYLPVRQHQFVNLDDPVYVIDNLHVSRGLTWAGLRWALTTTHSANWHPVTWLSHMADCAMWGLAPGGPHLTSLALHALNTLLLFLVLRALTGELWGSALVAGLFGVHPLHVESVAWVAERKDVLSGTFALMTIGCYVAYARRPAIGRYALTTALLAAGLAAKPMLVTLPLVLLLLDYWPLGRLRLDDLRTARAVVLEKVPWLLLAAASSALTFLAQQSEGAVGSIAEVSLARRLANAIVACSMYLFQTVWPRGLAAFYPHPYLPGGTPLAPWRVAAAAVLLAALSLAVIWLRQRQYLTVGWLWFLGMLVPVIGIVQVGEQARADRYTYLPLIGIFVALVWGLKDVTRRVPRLRAAMAAVAACALVGLAVVARAQVMHWRDSVTLFEHVLAVTGDNHVAHLNLGVVLEQRGDADAALKHYRSALRARPDDANVLASLAGLLLRLDRPDDAAAHLEHAIRVRPDHPVVLYNLGWLYEQRGERGRAAAAYERALAADPTYVDALINLGVLRAVAGDMAAAAGFFRRALETRPGDADALVNLGRVAEAYAAAGRRDEARSIAAEVVNRAVAAGRPEVVEPMRQRLQPLLSR